MKKLITILLILSLTLSGVLALSSCDDDGGNNHNDIGLSYYVPEDWEKLTVQYADHAYTNGEAHIEIDAQSYEELAEGTYNDMPDPWPTNVYDYVRQFVLYNSLPLSDYVYDEEKDVAYIDFEFEYPAEAGNMPDEYLLYVFMDNGEAIFVITYYCEVKYRETYEPLFHRWREMLELRVVKEKD